MLDDLKQVSPTPQANTDAVRQHVAIRLAEIKALRAQQGRQGAFRATQVIELAAEATSPGTRAEARTEGRGLTGATHGLMWATIGQPRNAVTPTNDPETVQIGIGGIKSRLPQPVPTNSSHCQEGLGAGRASKFRSVASETSLKWAESSAVENIMAKATLTQIADDIDSSKDATRGGVLCANQALRRVTQPRMTHALACPVVIQRHVREQELPERLQGPGAEVS